METSCQQREAALTDFAIFSHSNGGIGCPSFPS